MGINFFDSVETPSIVNLDKPGDILDLNKIKPGIKKVIIGSAWDDSMENDFSVYLDLYAITVTRSGQIRSQLKEETVKLSGKKWMAPVDMICPDHMKTKGIRLEGFEGDSLREICDGDDEDRIHLDLAQIDPEIEKIYFGVLICSGQEKNLTLQMYNNIYIKLRDEEAKDANGDYKEFARVPLKDHFGNSTYVIAAVLEKKDKGWFFTKIGDFGIGDRKDLLARFE